MRVVALGGGSGTSAVLGLTNLGYDLSLIVSVVDDGGSSGKLLESNPQLIPPGDIRKPAVLSSRRFQNKEIFENRFGNIPIPREYNLKDILGYHTYCSEMIEILKPYGILNIPLNINNLNGHNIGNLILSALMLKFGNTEGIRIFLEILDCPVEILPSAEKHSKFYFMARNSTRPDVGENLLDDFERSAEPITNCWLDPEVQAYKLCLDRIDNADVVLISPTSIYANIVSTLLIPGYREILNDKKII